MIAPSQDLGLSKRGDGCAARRPTFPFRSDEAASRAVGAASPDRCLFSPGFQMVKKYLVTGCAGFIASRVADLLLETGHCVVGVDNLNDAYDPRLKQWRLAVFSRTRASASIGWTSPTGRAWRPFSAGRGVRRPRLDREKPYSAVVNLAARAGVRPSVENPWVYYQANWTAR